MDRNCSMEELYEDDTFSCMVRYPKGLKNYRALKAPKRNHEMEVLVFWGPTGTGKTYAAKHEFEGSKYKLPQKKGSGTYWDRYDNQETVIIEEMYGNRFAWSFLLELLDEDDFEVPTHGGSINFNSKRVIFTSNKHPKEWYGEYLTKNNIDWDKSALCRRLTQKNNCIIHFTIQNGKRVRGFQSSIDYSWDQGLY